MFSLWYNNVVYVKPTVICMYLYSIYYMYYVL